MKNIIVPIDFSEYSEYALKAAALLSKKTAVTVYALHMLDIHEVSLSQSPEYSQEKAVFLLKLAEKRFKEFLKKDYLQDVKVVPIIKHYKVFSEVNSIAKEVDADFIIMGSHGASGLKEFFMGSNTEKVIRYAEVPVLVVKHELFDINFSDIVFATDFSEESIATFKKMLNSLDFLNARKHLLYVNLPNENFKTTPEMDFLANNFLMQAEGNVDRLINVNFVCAKSIEDGILTFSNLIGADLITLITNGRKGLSHVFTGSISEDISNHAALPIMTFKI
ncbi:MULTISPECIES: universal stress protein [unclassified Polaribacter]|uniref:universal stress protein n=1 Tax=unclassified Polaribacter TaxID=196858 RepID=UPI0011BE2A48|nr:MULTISPECIES: universal stress protein [unclassified Polaribacter]TXD54036.1 universal stress protein [Polaribacter sp. IC063]TXD62552.1 universal stress protein [Polaribacter sp. IC066]